MRGSPAIRARSSIVSLRPAFLRIRKSPSQRCTNLKNLGNRAICSVSNTANSSTPSISHFKRLFSLRRRQATARPAPHPVMAKRANSITFSCATYNIRGISDRWAERQPLLRDCIASMDADVYCFQECLTGEFHQDRALLPPNYHIFPCKSAIDNLAAGSSGPILRLYANWVLSALNWRPLRSLMVSIPAPLEALREKFNLNQVPFRLMRDLSLAPFFGNSVACRLADAHEITHSSLLLGDWRAAHRIEFEIKSEGGADEGLRIWIINTHLDHSHPDTRAQQATSLMKWAETTRTPNVAAVLICGDFNAPPDEVFHAHLREAGFRSAYLTYHGKEPEGTWPTGIQAPLMDEGLFECLDYIYIWEGDSYTVTIREADVYGDRPCKNDDTLYASDHSAIRATFEITRK